MGSDDLSPRMPAERHPRLWGTVFVLGMLGTAATVLWVPEVWPVLIVLPILFLVPMMREAQRRRVAQGEASRAAARYDRRTTAAIIAYLACVFGASYLQWLVAAEPALLWLVAALPALPILAVIWAMGRYLVEETDEYLRHQATMGALIGIAAVLVVATIWGFLETFGRVPHIPAWWVVPFFAVARDIGRAWLKARGR